MKNYFLPEETQCKCGCGGDITDGFRNTLNCIRSTVGRPLKLSSGFRCTEYDKSIGGHGVHPTGMAADVLCSGVTAFEMMKAASANGVQGFGISQKGPHGYRYIHIDMTKGKTRPWIWSYNC